jgi:hypothetical protein
MELQEKKEVGICLLFLLKYVAKTELLQQWWKSDTIKNLLAFLNLLQLTIKSIDVGSYFLCKINYHEK